jgi:hypothetical protein
MSEEELKQPQVRVIHSGWFAIIAYLVAGVSLVLACDARLRISQEADRNAVWRWCSTSNGTAPPTTG